MPTRQGPSRRSQGRGSRNHNASAKPIVNKPTKEATSR